MRKKDVGFDYRSYHFRSRTPLISLNDQWRKYFDIQFADEGCDLDTFKEVVDESLDDKLAGVHEHIDSAQEIISENIDGIRNDIPEIVETAVESGVQGIKDDIIAHVDEVKTGIDEHIEEAKDHLCCDICCAKNGVINKVEEAKDEIITHIDDAKTEIEEHIDTHIDGRIDDYFEEKFSDLNEQMSEIVNKLDTMEENNGQGDNNGATGDDNGGDDNGGDNGQGDDNGGDDPSVDPIFQAAGTLYIKYECPDDGLEHSRTYTICSMDYLQCISRIFMNGNEVVLENNESRLPDSGNVDIEIRPKSEYCTSIPEGAFSDCTYIKSIKLTGYYRSIGSQAFSGCANMKSFTIETETPPTLGRGVFSVTRDLVIYVPLRSLRSYKEAWPEYADIIQPITE